MSAIKTHDEINKIREGGRKLAAVLDILKKEIKIGMSSKELDAMAEKLILESGGEPSFKNYKSAHDDYPYPATVCISINDEVVHGIPSDRKFKNGDLVGLDIGMKYKGLFTDMAETVIMGDADENGEKLVKITKEALALAISLVKPGLRTGDLGYQMQDFIESHGFGVVRQLVGHGVGYKVHEDPQIPNWGRKGEGIKLKENMVIAIEPMVTEGDYKLFLAQDGWTWKTADGKRAAHFEHTMVVTSSGVEVLTKI
jgi:methionyl aminopeptidase